MTEIQDIPIQELITKLKAVHSLTVKIIEDSSFEEDDLRLSFLHSFKNVIEIYCQIYILYAYHIDTFLININDNKASGDKKSFEFNLSRHARVAIINEVYFSTGHLIEVLIKEVSNKKPSNQFSLNVDTILDLIDQNKHKEYFKALGDMRNALHNNGFHKEDKAKYEFTINTSEFEFVPGKLVNCIGWGHLFDFLDLFFGKIIPDIMSAKKISKLKHIRDLAYLENPFIK